MPAPNSNLHGQFAKNTADLLIKERKNFKLKFYLFWGVSILGIFVNCKWIAIMDIVSNGELWAISKNSYELLFTDYSLRNDTLYKMFPSVYHCDLTDPYGIAGEIQNESYLCSIPMNHYLEIFFVAFWNIAWHLLAFTVLEFAFIFLCLISPKFAMWVMPSNDLSQNWLGDVLKGMNCHEKAGLIVVLLSIQRNVSTFTFKAILKSMHEKQQQNNNATQQQGNNNATQQQRNSNSTQQSNYNGTPC